MADDPWAAYRTGVAATGDDPWAKFRAAPSMSGEDQPKPDDPITAAVRKEYAEDKAKGIPMGSPTQRLMLQGATFNAADEILAGMATPIEMLKRKTWSPAEGYRYAKAREDIALEEARKNGGLMGTAAELGGGVLSGSTLARGGLSAFNALRPGANLLERSIAGAADALGYGTVSGALEGNTLEERGKNALIGGGTGLVVGGASPAVVKVAGQLISPITNNIRARINPTGVAQGQFARSLAESGRTPQQIADDVAMAAQEGQGVFTVADAMGHPGQRALSGVTRSPGQGRTDAVEFLEQRQAGQGRRVANTLAEGFDAPQTAAQTEARMTAARDTASDIAYPAARKGAGAVDLSSAVSKLDETLQPGVNQIVSPASGIADDTIESVLRGVRSRLTDGKSVLSDYTAVERVRGDIADQIKSALKSGQNNKARLLKGVLTEIDASMEAASPGFKAANAAHSRASRNIEAVDAGKDASMRGRTEDTIPAFRALGPRAQEGYRAGYADPLIADAQKGPLGVNKARPFTSDAFQEEAAAIAPLRTGNQMTRRLGRENTMFETRRQATGGSQTADNLADQEALREAPSLVARLGAAGLTGNIRNVISLGSNALSGSTPEVRAEIARLLLQRGNNPQVKQILDQIVKKQEIARMLSHRAASGAFAGASLVPSASNSRR